MYQPWPPQLLGGTAACLLLTFYPPVLVAFAEEWQRSGRPLDPCTRLIPRWHTAVTGTADDIERLRRAAAAAHSRVHGPMPAEVDAARFGASYAVSGDVMTTMYVIVLYLMLAAQEFLGHLLADDAQRDLYCELAASTAGYAFGVQDQAPATISGLRQAWQAIIAGPAAGHRPRQADPRGDARPPYRRHPGPRARGLRGAAAAPDRDRLAGPAARPAEGQPRSAARWRPPGPPPARALPAGIAAPAAACGRLHAGNMPGPGDAPPRQAAVVEFAPACWVLALPPPGSALTPALARAAAAGLAAGCPGRRRACWPSPGPGRSTAGSAAPC